MNVWWFAGLVGSSLTASYGKFCFANFQWRDICVGSLSWENILSGPQWTSLLPSSCTKSFFQLPLRQICVTRFCVLCFPHTAKQVSTLLSCDVCRSHMHIVELPVCFALIVLKTNFPEICYYFFFGTSFTNIVEISIFDLLLWRPVRGNNGN